MEGEDEKQGRWTKPGILRTWLYPDGVLSFATALEEAGSDHADNEDSDEYVMHDSYPTLVEKMKELGYDILPAPPDDPAFKDAEVKMTIYW